MITVTFTGSAALGILILLSLFYKRKERVLIDKGKHKLWFIYGLAMFIADRIPAKNINHNHKVNEIIKELAVKENIEKERYMYFVKKTAMCIFAVWITFLITLAISISEKNDDRVISTITRSVKTDVEHSLKIKTESGKTEQVTVNVARKEYTKEQIEKIFNQRKEELIKKVLGENKSPEKVNKDLNLVTEVGEEKILVAWNISDSSKIGYDGVLSEKIDKKGEAVILTATMSLKKVSCDYNFAVNVFPPAQKNGVKEKLQEYINENDKYAEQVRLPAKINGESVRYETITSDMSGYVLLIGIAIAVLLFFLQNNDLKKQVEKRNQQLQNDYPEIVSEILLYYDAGLSIRRVIERIVKGYEEEKRQNKKLYRYAYEELNMCFVKIKSGVSEIEAIKQYGNRCRLHCYIKLAGLIEQNIRRGTKELSLVLKSELKEAMNEKKNNMLKQGGQISTKLLGPMVIMLMIAIVIIMVPAFMSMSF